MAFSASVVVVADADGYPSGNTMCRIISTLTGELEVHSTHKSMAVITINSASSRDLSIH